MLLRRSNGLTLILIISTQICRLSGGSLTYKGRDVSDYRLETPNTQALYKSTEESKEKFADEKNRYHVTGAVSAETEANATMPADAGFWDHVLTVVGHVVTVAAQFFIVFGGVIPFVFQWIEIKRRNSAKGFSLYVCLTQLIAHTLRIMFWFGKHFEMPLLAQAVVMILAMWILIHTAVNTTRRHITYPYKGVTVWSGHMISHFWAWTDFGSYFFVYTLFVCVVSIITSACLGFYYYVEAIGFAALLIEANLGSPQAIRNWQRKSTEGMSVKMVLAWTIGDIGKTTYFFTQGSPAQFYICGIIQICIDIIIMLQVFWYGKKTDAAAKDAI